MNPPDWTDLDLERVSLDDSEPPISIDELVEEAFKPKAIVKPQYCAHLSKGDECLLCGEWLGEDA